MSENANVNLIQGLINQIMRRQLAELTFQAT